MSEDESKMMIEMLRNQLEAAGLKPFDKVSHGDYLLLSGNRVMSLCVVQVVSFEHAKAKLQAAVQRLMRGDLQAESELEEWDAGSLRLRCACPPVLSDLATEGERISI